MKILVIGGTGFLGTKLVTRLALKHRVTILDRHLPKGKSYKVAGIEYRYGDLLDKHSLRMALKDADIVYSLAARLPAPGVKEKAYWQINVQGMKNLAGELAKNIHIKQLIHVSTAYTEWGTLKTNYELTKLKGEKIINQLEGLHQFGVTIVKPGFIYGEGNEGLIKFVKAVKTGKFFYVGSGNNLFEMTHIRDVINFLVAVAGRKNTYGKTYILSEVHPLPFRKVVDLISHELKVKHNFLHLPRLPFLILALANENLAKIFSFSLPYSLSTFKTLTENRAFDSMAARKAGFTNSVSLEDGLHRVVVDFQKNAKIAQIKFDPLQNKNNHLRSKFWDNYARSFVSIRESLSSNSLFKGELRLCTDYLKPNIRKGKFLKLDLWNEVFNTPILESVWSFYDEVYGIDISPLVVREATKIMQIKGFPVMSTVGDIRKLPYKDNFFDYVFTMGTIEHIPHPIDAMREIYRVLKPGGRAVIGVPNKNEWFGKAYVLDFLAATNLKGDGREISCTWNSITRDLDSCGFKIIAKTGPYFMPWFIRLADWFTYQHFPGLKNLFYLPISFCDWLSNNEFLRSNGGSLISPVVEKPFK